MSPPRPVRYVSTHKSRVSRTTPTPTPTLTPTPSVGSSIGAPPPAPPPCWGCIVDRAATRHSSLSSHSAASRHSSSSHLARSYHPAGRGAPLDVTAFPHLLDLVVALAPRASLLKLRCVSRQLRDKADALLFEHILLTRPEFGLTDGPSTICRFRGLFAPWDQSKVVVLAPPYCARPGPLVPPRDYAKWGLQQDDEVYCPPQGQPPPATDAQLAQRAFLARRLRYARIIDIHGHVPGLDWLYWELECANAGRLEAVRLLSDRKGKLELSPPPISAPKLVIFPPSRPLMSLSDFPQDTGGAVPPAFPCVVQHVGLVANACKDALFNLEAALPPPPSRGGRAGAGPDSDLDSGFQSDAEFGPTAGPGSRAPDDDWFSIPGCPVAPLCPPFFTSSVVLVFSAAHRARCNPVDAVATSTQRWDELVRYIALALSRRVSVTLVEFAPAFRAYFVHGGDRPPVALLRAAVADALQGHAPRTVRGALPVRTAPLPQLSPRAAAAALAFLRHMRHTEYEATLTPRDTDAELVDAPLYRPPQRGELAARVRGADDEDDSAFDGDSVFSEDSGLDADSGFDGDSGLDGDGFDDSGSDGTAPAAAHGVASL